MSARRRRGARDAGDGPPARRRRLPWNEMYPTLDLHGETGESARKSAEAWLGARRAEGAGTVRVITGRGLHSIGPPVLPGEIAELLGRLKGSVVAGWESEPGGGAYRVELIPVRTRRSAETRPASGEAAPPAARVREDAALRRRAEESLAELGITPTPALLKAEMRRLSRDDG